MEDLHDLARQAACAPSSAWRKRDLSNAPSHDGNTSGSRVEETLRTTSTGRLRQSQSQSDRDCASHRAPEIKIERVIADSGAVIGRRAQTRHHEHIAAIAEYSSDRAAAQQLVWYVHRFSP